MQGVISLHCAVCREVLVQQRVDTADLVAWVILHQELLNHRQSCPGEPPPQGTPPIQAGSLCTCGHPASSHLIPPLGCSRSGCYCHEFLSI